MSNALGNILLLAAIALIVAAAIFTRKFIKARAAGGAHAPHTGSGGGGHAHHDSNLLSNVLVVCAVIFTIAYVLKVGREYGQPPSLSTWNQRVPSQSDASDVVVATVSTRPVPFEMPTDSWYVIEGEPGFNVEICRASDEDCTEAVPIGYRMQCVTKANETVDWTPEACHSFIRLMLQSTGTGPVTATHRYVPKKKP